MRIKTTPSLESASFKQEFSAYFWPKNRTDLKIRVVSAFVLLLAAKGVAVYLPFLYKAAIDQLSGPQALVAAPIFIIISYCVARVFCQILSEIRDVIFSHVTFHAVRQASRETFEHLHSLSLRFHLDRRTGSVSRAIEKGSLGIENIMSFLLFNIVPTLIEIVFVCGVLFKKYNPLFSIITFITLLTYIIFTLVITNWRDSFRRIMNEAESDASGKAVDSLLNYETVKYFGNEALEVDRFDALLIRYQNASIKSQRSLMVLNLGQGAIIAVGLAAVMILSAQEIVAHTMTNGDFVLVNTFLTQLYVPLHFLGYMYRLLKQSLIDMENMNKLRSVTAEVKDIEMAPDLDVKQGTVSFESVSFSYDERVPILKGVSFTIPAGKMVAVVGSSGAVNLPYRASCIAFTMFLRGRITIDGHDIREVSQQSLRAAIGIVPQDSVLFNESIFYNIQYGRPSAAPEEIYQAARLAQIHTFIESLPDGYNTRVGERGLKLSGGEKQRVAIARVILKNPSLLIFDEATSALDIHTEKEIQKEIFNVAQNKTTLIIAHRLSTIVNADSIIVLDQGQVSEQGTHYELMALNGLYAGMWARQQKT